MQRPISILFADTPQVSPMMHLGGRSSCITERSKPKEFAEALGLGAADWNFGLFLVVQAQLIRAFEPGNDFLDPVNVYQERTVGAPEEIGIEAIQQFLEGAAVGLPFHAVRTTGHHR